jgi:cytochrome c556
MAEQKEESSKMRQDVEKLIAAIEQNRIHVKMAYEKVENLDAAIQSAKRTHEKLTSSFPTKKAA